MLKRLKVDHVIVLTTHLMDEADFLAGERSSSLSSLFFNGFVDENLGDLEVAVF